MKIISSIVLVLSSLYAFSLENTEKIELVKKQSSKLAEYIKAESLSKTLSVFGDEATLLPEYHKSLRGKSKINEYYTQFFEKTVTSKFSKEPFEILDLGMCFIELGTFEHTYKTPKNKEFHYKGKYTTYWFFNGNQTPRIIAHIWGASHYFEEDNLNFISVDVPDNNSISINTMWEKEIEDSRKSAYKAVFTRDTPKQLESYAEDATYMTYYDPPFVGKSEITKYFNVHNDSAVPMDSLMTKSVKVIDMGDHALKFGEYYVGWTWEGQPSYIEGKGLTLYKRMEDGSIKIYRQMINHSMPASPKK